MTDLQEVVYDILQEVYEEAEPGLDFEDLRENPEDYPDDWYSQHYLDEEREREILEKHLEKHDLTEREESQITFTVILDMGPSNVPPDE